MKFFLEDRYIPVGKVGFQDNDHEGRPYDMLGRADTGKRISDLVERIDQPLVIAFDGEWGSGKSHFLKLWTGAHVIENGGTARVIYFDAFEHDYLDDPLPSLVGTVQEQWRDKKGVANTFSRVRTAAAKLAKPITRVGLAAATAGATEIAVAAVDPILEATGKELSKAVDDFWKKESARRSAMEEFRKALVGLTEVKDGPPQKIVFVVDELDRCRPDFALALLEIIKHFFAVPNVHFVLGSNLRSLENSVRARYGDKIDAAGYLKKFIHLTLKPPRSHGSLDAHAATAYFRSLSNLLQVPSAVASEIEHHFRYLTRQEVVSLRDVERIVAHTQLIPKLGLMQNGYRYLLVAATMLRILAPDTYSKLRSGSATHSDILSIYGLDSSFDTDDGFITWSREFWMAALSGVGSGDEFRRYLRDCFSGDRKEYVEQILGRHLDNFTFQKD
ncbi:KAP family P-loop NTPase fold protein [Defluviimonas sp. SAOS-178_SWC]|uniref:KAP family P-loop NTPase fold protein n=1 Tax=Defluviimonas sp. SAOS-178_SWC TaxID=3121287 RepID=UPI0032216DC6